MPATGAEQADPSRLRTSTEGHRQTTKWIITVFAGLGSVLVAGLSFADIGRLALWSIPFWCAAAGAALALAAVGWVLVSAVQVLATTYDTLQQIVAHMERAEEQQSEFEAQLTDPLVQAIERERTTLFGSEASDLRDLFRQFVQNTNRQRQANRDLVQLSSQEARLLETDLRKLEVAVANVVDFAEHWTTKKRFDCLLRRLLVCGATAGIGVFIFAVAVSRQEQPKTRVTGPTPVTVFFSPEGRRWSLEEVGCDRASANGVAIGGNFEEPVVAIPQDGPCRAGRVHLRANLGIAVPAAKP